jgi:hypothetical protein
MQFDELKARAASVPRWRNASFGFAAVRTLATFEMQAFPVFASVAAARFH